MNLGDFLVRPAALPRPLGSPMVVLCAVCGRDVEPYDGPDAYVGGSTLAVLALDAAAHVRHAHPAEEWNP